MNMNIVKSVIFVLTLSLVDSVAADHMRNITGSIPNQAEGKIVFTTAKTIECGPKAYFVYAQDKSKTDKITGCYTYINDCYKLQDIFRCYEGLIARYEDGIVYSYDIQQFEFPEDFLSFIRQEQENQVSQNMKEENKR